MQENAIEYVIVFCRDRTDLLTSMMMYPVGPLTSEELDEVNNNTMEYYDKRFTTRGDTYTLYFVPKSELPTDLKSRLKFDLLQKDFEKLEHKDPETWLIPVFRRAIDCAKAVRSFREGTATVAPVGKSTTRKEPVDVQGVCHQIIETDLPLYRIENSYCMGRGSLSRSKDPLIIAACKFRKARAGNKGTKIDGIADRECRDDDSEN